jgi:programmed cell death 6-interacting protein
MPNQLSVPFKVGYTAPIREAVNNYLLAHGEAHPEEFKWDIGRWEKLRQDAISGVVHVNQIDALLTSVCWWLQHMHCLILYDMFP